MTDLIVRENNLPTTLEDLSAFVLFNDEKVKAVRAALSAMHKLKAPREVYELKLREAQELSEQVALAKMELGKRISEIPKATNNNPTGNNQYSGQIDSPVDSTLKQKPKSETIAELGLTQKQYKLRNAEVPFGQMLALKRLVDNLERAGKYAVLIIAEHTADNPNDDIDAASCRVRTWYQYGYEHAPADISVKNLIDKIIARIDG